MMRRAVSPFLRALGLALGAALVTALLAACSGPPTEDLFPLEKGRSWTYDVKTEWENNTVDHESLHLSNHGWLKAEGLEGAGWNRRSDSGLDYWLRSDETGIYRVASKSDLDEEAKPDKPVRYVLKMPLAVGTSWPASTTAYLLRRRQEFPPEIRHSHPSIPMVYSIDALGEKVDTRAGSFSGCVRVKGVAKLKLFADPVVGWTEMPLTTLEWYCPGMGLVKLERREPANSTFLTGGTLTMELTEWE